jgi:hypothetical protein
MPFVQKILRERSCPRCNAIAQERLEDRDKSVIIILWCDKCKLKRNLGITTRRALKLKKRQKKLRESLSQARNQRTRSSLQARIMRLEEEINRAEMGIT